MAPRLTQLVVGFVLVLLLLSGAAAFQHCLRLPHAAFFVKPQLAPSSFADERWDGVPVVSCGSCFLADCEMVKVALAFMSIPKSTLCRKHASAVTVATLSYHPVVVVLVVVVLVFVVVVVVVVVVATVIVVVIIFVVVIVVAACSSSRNHGRRPMVPSRRGFSWSPPCICGDIPPGGAFIFSASFPAILCAQAGKDARLRARNWMKMQRAKATQAKNVPARPSTIA